MDNNKVSRWFFRAGVASLVYAPIWIATRWDTFRGLPILEILKKVWGIPLGIVFLLIYFVMTATTKKDQKSGDNGPL